jgi:hypothetical protein
MHSVGLTTDTATGGSSGTTDGDSSSNGFSTDSSTNDSGGATELFFGDGFIGRWLNCDQIVHVLTPLDGGQLADSRLRRNEIGRVLSCDVDKFAKKRISQNQLRPFLK